MGLIVFRRRILAGLTMTPKSRGAYRYERRMGTRALSSRVLTVGASICTTLFLLQALFGVEILPSSSSAANVEEKMASARAARDERLLASRPRPLVVVAAGLPRTGSTWIYNVLRILMRQRDPNTIAGWYADLQNIWRNHKTHRYDNMQVSWLTAYKSLGTSILIKMHGPSPFRGFSRGLSLGEGADLTVLTHRDLRSEVRSWVYQNFNSSVHAGKVDDTPFGDSAQWVRVAHRILTERNSTLNSIGNGNYLDIRYEDWNDKDADAQLAIVRSIADKLEWHFDDDQLRDCILEAARIRPPDTGAVLMYNPVSKLHPGHTRIDAQDESFQKALQDGFHAIEEDDTTSRFLRSQGYL